MLPDRTASESRTVHIDVQDCSRPTTLVFWFVAGVVLAVTMMSNAASAWPSLLHVGSTNPLLHRIERDLGQLSLGDPIGHDGQLYYLIARDPLGREGTPDAVAQFDPNGARYRYRRILFPLLAGGFGQFNGRATLAAMILFLAMAMGLATIAIADLSFHLKVRPGAVLWSMLNAGALVSLLLLTADTLALALALIGISLTLRAQTRWAVVAFALAALTKEVYLLVPWSLAAHAWTERRRTDAATLAILPVLPLGAWSGWLLMSLPSPAVPAANIGVPFVGLLQAVLVWVRSERNPVEIVLAVFATITFAGSLVMLAIGRVSVLRWVVAPWVVLACFSTLKVWGKPNNAARVFAILWPLVVLLISERLARGKLRPELVNSRVG
jgi:hypothetical protein